MNTPMSSSNAARAPLKRSNAPVYWVMFGGGGTLSSLFGPALVLITGLLAPLGILAGVLAPERALALAQHPLGKLALAAVVVFFAWHAVHRVYKTLHDFGIHPGPLPWACCYGSAALVSLVAVGALLGIGF